MNIHKVAVLGANGNMGSLSGGIFAQAGIQCYFFARTQEKAEKGKQNAIKQARSEVLDKYITSLSYDDLDKVIPECDWIFEGLGENLELKKSYYEKIDALRKKDSIVSTVSSGLSIEEMVEGLSDSIQNHFLGTHFYNPPGKLVANELIFHSKNSEEFKKKISDFCGKVLSRANIETFNVPAFAGNRIGFQFLNEAVLLAEKHGIEKIDYLLGPYTGRAMPPLATVDLVGFDVHKAIVDNIYEKTNDERHETLKIPVYMQKMLDNGQMGLKTPVKGGFFKRTEGKKKLVFDIQSNSYKELEKPKVEFVEKMKQNIHNGLYQDAVSILKQALGEEADIVRYFIAVYISYSFHRVGEVTPERNFIHGIDRVMSFGFSWLSPSGWVDTLGGAKETIAFLEKTNVAVPEALKLAPDGIICQISEPARFLIGR